VKNRIGLVGCGAWGQYILRDLNTLGCQVSVVVRSQTSIARAKAMNAHKIVPNIEEIPEVDGYVVATPTFNHVETIERLLPFARPIFVEKPMSSSPKQAALLAQKAQGMLFVMDKWRYHLGVQKLRDLAVGKQFGNLLGIKTTRIGWGNPHADCDTIWHLTPHDLSIAYEILGYLPSPRSAVAEVLGEPVSLVAILGERPFVHIEISSRSQTRKRSVALHFERAIATLNDGYDDFIEVVFDAGKIDQLPQSNNIHFEQQMPLYAELQAFVEFLNGGSPPRSSALEGAANVHLIEQLRQMAGLPASDSQ
jgi:predicted dehydrogenase